MPGVVLTAWTKARTTAGALALDPPQGGHDRDRPVRPPLLRTWAFQVPFLNGDAVGQNGDGIMGAGALDLGGEHGGHGCQVGAAALPQPHGAGGSQHPGYRAQGPRTQWKVTDSGSPARRAAAMPDQAKGETTPTWA